MPAEVLVGLIAATAAVLVAVVSRYGSRADRAQVAVRDKAAEEHRAFDELKQVADLRAIDLRQAVADRREAEEDRRRCEAEVRRARSDLAAAYLVLRDEVSREAIRTEHDIADAEEAKALADGRELLDERLEYPDEAEGGTWD